MSLFIFRSPVLIHDCAGRAGEYVLGFASKQAELKDRTTRVTKASILRAERAKVQRVISIHAADHIRISDL